MQDLLKSTRVPCNRRSRLNARGFTLIELMIAAVIVAIIAAIAIPSYNSSVMKSNRSAAKAALLDLASREEKYYTVNNNYVNGSDSTFGTDLYGPTSTVTPPIYIPGTGTALYVIQSGDITTQAATSNSPATFTITAEPTGPQADDQCGSFVLNSTGQESAAMTSGCW